MGLLVGCKMRGVCQLHCAGACGTAAGTLAASATAAAALPTEVTHSTCLEGENKLRRIAIKDVSNVPAQKAQATSRFIT
jgi:hypothetical protein